MYGWHTLCKIGGLKMKNTGVVRKVDQLGRVVLPKELRRILDIIENETSMEIFVEGEQIILKKYQPACIFCGDARDVVNYRGKNICRNCLKELKEGK
uniref:AbrB family transcriptional regulator n=4 Tax=Clostridium TaxID=1485 RepID=A0AA40IRI8_CLONO|nr:AbrB family transcriptional regulator [Clostridium novyi B str. ATCC 27606]